MWGYPNHALEKQKCCDYAFEKYRNYAFQPCRNYTFKKYSCPKVCVNVRVHPMLFKSIVSYHTFQKCSFYTL